MRFLEARFRGEVKGREQIPDPGFGKGLVRAVPHLLEHVVNGFLNALFGHSLFPVLQIPACPGIAASRAPRRAFQLVFNALLVRFGQHRREIEDVPGGLAGGLADDLRIPRRFGLPSPVVRRLLHERINIGLGIRRVPETHHVPVNARMRLALLPKETAQRPASDCADNRTHNGNHGTHSCAYRSERSCGKGTKPPPGCTAKPRRNPAVLALRKSKRPAEHGVAKGTKAARHKIRRNSLRERTHLGCGHSGPGSIAGKHGGLCRFQPGDVGGPARGGHDGPGGSGVCRCPESRREPSGHRVIDGIRNAGCPRTRHKIAEAGKVAHPANAAGTTGAPRRIRHPARAEHTGHRPRNLNRNGPGDRHVHQIGKERREQ